MKTIFTLSLALFVGMAAKSQNAAAEVKVDSVAMSVIATTLEPEVVLKNENAVARLYMFRNSKITKALSFSTKLNKAKLA
ncbi:hypothetical protein [Arenibacter sp. ARW7G5Y1]|uniref:hypothetical protein n=1 Tax=Arenibacter sp. ARW7G5Y1 TaxID=2135619 RepID=UPI000D770907|nr:hypothetical protein [Arenibacter sp. ARW7G5Y1]PXX24276.1 hypothetical protein C7972_11678 [Arenibacter sp. ARW7G5Y1]|tara:strand:- start:438 stop:677 length:240 start_codon:yes stop_codon:yes gene_type:complete